MSRLLLRKQRVIGEIAVDSGTIVELRVFRGSRKARSPHLAAQQFPPLSVLGGVLGVGPPLVTGSH